MSKNVKLIISIPLLTLLCILVYFIYRPQAQDSNRITWVETLQDAPKIVFSFTEYAPRNDDGNKSGVDEKIFLVGTEQISNPIHNSTNEFDGKASLIEQFYEEYENKIKMDKNWNEVLSLQADGPGSSQTGYRTNDKWLEEYIIFSYHTEHEREVLDGANECPCTTVFKIFRGVSVKIQSVGAVDQTIVSSSSELSIDIDSDYNFDGYNDITSLYSEGAGYSAIRSYNIFLYEPKTNTFVFNPQLSDLENIGVDENKKEVYQDYYYFDKAISEGGVQMHNRIVYKWKDGVLAKTSEKTEAVE